jgi:CBS domain-containing membrane protein
MTEKLADDAAGITTAGNSPEMELTDGDILDAMQHIPGYLDITTEDFRLIYHLAYRHAQDRLFSNITASRLMRTDIKALAAEMTLDKAAVILVESGYKGLPVVDANGHVIGMLTETDYLRHLHAENFLDLMLQMFDHSYEFSHRCHDTLVSAAMTQAVVTVRQDASSVEIMDAISQHGGRSMPVVGANGKLVGLLLHKDFLKIFQLKASQ